MQNTHLHFYAKDNLSANIKAKNITATAIKTITLSATSTITASTIITNSLLTNNVSASNMITNVSQISSINSYSGLNSISYTDLYNVVSSIKNPTSCSITNLVYTGNYPPYTVTWTENNSLFRTATFINGAINKSDVITNLTAGGCTLGNPNTLGLFTLTVTVSNLFTTASASINISVTCFLGFVLLQTRNGPVCVKDITVGTEMLQPDGSYSKVVECKNSLLTESIYEEDRRLFADPEEKCIVTYWHKVRFSDDAEEVKAGEYSRFHEVFRDLPTEVFHLKLENPVKDKLIVYDSDIIAEGFVPVNPA
jgi:hypothetical protein